MTLVNGMGVNGKMSMFDPELLSDFLLQTRTRDEWKHHENPSSLFFGYKSWHQTTCVYIVNITSKSHLTIPRLILTFLQSLPSPHIPAMNLLTKRLTEGAHAFQQTYGPKDADQAQDTQDLVSYGVEVPWEKNIFESSLYLVCIIHGVHLLLEEKNIDGFMHLDMGIGGRAQWLHNITGGLKLKGPGDANGFVSSAWRKAFQGNEGLKHLLNSLESSQKLVANAFNMLAFSLIGIQLPTHDTRENAWKWPMVWFQCLFPQLSLQ